MIIVALDGGLGNQMFEYAFYLALKECFPNEDVRIDLCFINPKIHNGYELQKIFGVKPLLCSRWDAIRFSDYYPKYDRKKYIIHLFFLARKKLFKKKKTFFLQGDATEYFPECFELKKGKNYYFKGVWANAQYFANTQTLVKSTFSFPNIGDEVNRKWQQMMEETNSVSVHFRGGDYYQDGFQVMDGLYYKKAVKYIEERISKPAFFIFTDDPQNAKNVIGDREDFCYICNNKGENSYIDMQLMSCCKHNIIANSTFSFWGAYLNENAGKIVIAPNKTVGSCKKPYCNEGWILL